MYVPMERDVGPRVTTHMGMGVSLFHSRPIVSVKSCSGGSRPMRHIRTRRSLSGVSGSGRNISTRTSRRSSSDCFLADVDAQWDLFLANTYTFDELRILDYNSVRLPKEWFVDWLRSIDA